jgi:MFS family permease
MTSRLFAATGGECRGQRLCTRYRDKPRALVNSPVGDLPNVRGKFLAGPLIGRASDAFGKLRVFAFGCAMTIIMVIIYTHLHATPFWVLVTVMVLLQIGIFSRMISSSALMSALPRPAERGSYMSISSSLQQVSGGLAAVIAGLIVTQVPGGPLLHFDTLGYILVCSTLVSLAFMYLINQKIIGMRPTADPLARVASVTE